MTPRSTQMVPFERPHPLSYLTSVDTFCVSCTVFEIIGIFVCMENPYSRPNFGGFPDFRTPYPNFLQFKPPKGTSLGQSASFEPSRMQIGRRVRAGRVPEKQRKKERKKKSHHLAISPPCGGATARPISTKLGSVGGWPNVITHA